MDWDNIEPDRYRLMNKNFTPGRGGHEIKYIVIHHNAGCLSIDQIWQVWQTREASAHYQVDVEGTIGQLVNDQDTAWHAADLLRNQESIGIEHANSAGPDADWPISEATREAGAHLVAALCKYYGLGRPQWGQNVRPHSETGQTSCPYRLGPDGDYGQDYIARAQYWYDQMTNPAPTPPEETPVAQISDSRKLDLILDQAAGPERNPDGSPRFTGWFDGKTPVDDIKQIKADVAAIRKMMEENR